MAPKMGEHELEWGRDLTELRESTDIADDPNALRERFEEEGYLFVRGFHDPDLVGAARGDVIAQLEDRGLLDPDEPPERAVIGPDGGGLFIDGPDWEEFSNLYELVEGEAVMDFFASFLEALPITFDYKWGRAIERGGFTGFHYDAIFMGRGTDDLYTLWTPLGDVPIEMGPLVIAPGAERNERLRETYGRMDVDRDVFEAMFSKDPHDAIDVGGGPLATADFEAGDALLFGQYNLHGSLSNQTDRYRISVDTRYQSVEEPVDGRWMGRDPVGHYAWPADDETPMAELRDEWGV